MMNDKNFFGQFANVKPYDYRRAVTYDIRNGINDICPNDISDSYQGDPVGFLSDTLRDGITGNSDGSYWCDRWKSECSLFGNRGMLKEYADWSGFNEIFTDEPEVQDVKIRECIFNGCAEQVIRQLRSEPVYALSDIEILFLIVTSDEWEPAYIVEAARRVDMSEEWKAADADKAESVADEIIRKLKERAR